MERGEKRSGAGFSECVRGSRRQGAAGGRVWLEKLAIDNIVSLYASV